MAWIVSCIYLKGTRISSTLLVVSWDTFCFTFLPCTVPGSWSSWQQNDFCDTVSLPKQSPIAPNVPPGLLQGYVGSWLLWWMHTTFSHGPMAWTNTDLQLAQQGWKQMSWPTSPLWKVSCMLSYPLSSSHCSTVWSSLYYLSTKPPPVFKTVMAKSAVRVTFTLLWVTTIFVTTTILTSSYFAMRETFMPVTSTDAIFQTIPYLNHSCNFPIYLASVQSFREEFCKMMGCDNSANSVGPTGGVQVLPAASWSNTHLPGVQALRAL